MVLENWTLACLTAERLVNTVVLVWWRYHVHSFTRALHVDIQSAFKAIIMDRSELSNFTNPLLLLPIDTIQMCSCC